MRRDRYWLTVLAVVALVAVPCSTRAQSTSTDAAIAELRQLLADQRAELVRQSQIIEEQGRALSALQQQIQTTAAAGTAQQAQPSRTAAANAPDLPVAVVSAGEFPGSLRIPGTESSIKLGGQARLVAVHTLDALGTEDKFVTSSIPVGVVRAGEEARTVYSPTASRLSTELRMPSERGPMRMFIESDFAAAGKAMRLRHAFLQTNRFVVGQTWSTFSDPQADPIGIDFEGLNAISRLRQPLFRFTPSSTASRYQWAFALENPAPSLTGAEGVNFAPDFVARLRYEPDRKRGLLLHTGHVQAALLVRHWRDGLHVIVVTPGNFLLVALDHFGRVQAEITGIAADKSNRIGSAGKIFQAIFLDRFQVILTDLQIAGDRGQIVATAQASGTQFLPDRVGRCIAVAGNFAQMDAATAGFLVSVQWRYLGHQTLAPAARIRDGSG